MPAQKKQVKIEGYTHYPNAYKYQSQATKAWKQAIALIKRGKVKFIPVRNNN